MEIWGAIRYTDHVSHRTGPHPGGCALENEKTGNEKGAETGLGMDAAGHRAVNEIDFDALMDLRVDYAFKLLFSKGEPRLLISLLNAVFANKGVKRVIRSLTIKDPHLERESAGDKLSVLDIRAELDGGTDVLIEMHMYRLGELKAKTIRSWARAYGGDLKPGKRYTAQPPVIAVTFSGGRVESDDGAETADRIHRLCMITDRDDGTVFTDAMELHYIDMKAFAKAVNEAGGIDVADANGAMFAKWLAVITQKEIVDKGIVKDVCEGEEVISLAVSTLAKQGEDKYTRQAYQRRQDEIYFANKEKHESDQKLARANRKAELVKRRARRREEQARRREEQARLLAAQEKQRAEQAFAEIARLTAMLEEKQGS